MNLWGVRDQEKDKIIGFLASQMMCSWYPTTLANDWLCQGWKILISSRSSVKMGGGHECFCIENIVGKDKLKICSIWRYSVTLFTSSSETTHTHTKHTCVSEWRYTSTLHNPSLWEKPVQELKAGTAGQELKQRQGGMLLTDLLPMAWSALAFFLI